MAEIIKPEQAVTFDRAKISLSAATAPGLAQAATAQDVQQAGEQIEQAGQSYFDAAKKANQTAIYSKVYSDSVLSFNKLTQARTAKLVDKDGNPNFESLTADIGRIGEEVLAEQTKNVHDPEVNTMISANFKNYVNNQQISSLNTARNQQLQFVQTSVSTSLTKLSDQAIASDELQLQELDSQAEFILNNALQTGAISPQKHANDLEAFRSTTRTIRVRNRLDADKQLALSLMQQPLSKSAGDEGFTEEFKKKVIAASSTTLEALKSNSAESLKLTNSERDQMIAEAEALKSDVTRDVNKAEKILSVSRKNEQSLIIQELETGMAEGVTGLKEIEERKNEIPKIEYLKLREKYASKNRSDSSVLDSMQDISDNIINGERLVGRHSQSQIDTHFKKTTELLRDPRQPNAPVSLANKASVAARYQAPLKQYQQELGHAAAFGSAEDALDAIKSHKFLMATNPAVLEGLPIKQSAIITSASTLMETTNMKPKEALSLARDRVLAVKDGDLQFRNKEFNKIADFNTSEGLSKITREIAKDSSFLGFFSAQVQTSTERRVHALLREGYSLTGDEDDAKEFASNQLKFSLGESNINGEEEVMFFAPEKMFPQFTKEDLRATLDQALSAEVLQDNPDVTSIKIRSDALTRGIFSQTGQEVVSYTLAVPLPGGGEKPLVREDGTQVRWFPEASEVTGMISEREKAEAAELRQEALGDDGTSIIDVFPDHEPETVLEHVVGKTITRPSDVNKRELGTVSRKFESGGAGPGTISNVKGDPGGASFGEFQLASKTGTLQKYIKQAKPKFKEKLENLRPASKAFMRNWRELAEDPEFARDQQQFILDRSFKPARKFADKVGIPSTFAIDELVFSMAVQHGGVRTILKNATKKGATTEIEYIEALFEARREYVQGLGSLSDKLKKTLMNRYIREKRVILGLIEE